MNESSMFSASEGSTFSVYCVTIFVLAGYTAYYIFFVVKVSIISVIMIYNPVSAAS
jgi:hypothetical protein